MKATDEVEDIPRLQILDAVAEAVEELGPHGSENSVRDIVYALIFHSAHLFACVRIWKCHFSGVRMSVYLTEELKAKMDEFETSFPSRVNWSEVAQRAFRKHMVTMKVNRNLTRGAVVERLRVSREEELATANANGLKEGRRWAETKATYGDLRKIERDFDPQIGAPEDATIEWVVRLLDQDRESGLVWEDLIERHLYEEMGFDPAFVEGFLTGALEVWEDVKDDVFEDS